MTVEGSICQDCGEPLVDVTRCSLCGAPTGQQSTVPDCDTCGAALEPGTVFCTTCGTRIDAQPEPEPVSTPAPSLTPPPSPPARGGPARWLMFGAVVVVAILGVLWLVASWSADQEAIQGTEDLASVQLPSDEVDGDTNAGLALAETTTTRPTSTSTSASASASASASTTPESGSASTLVLFTGRDAIYGRYVAVLWSGFVSANSSQDADQSPETQLASFQSRFGSDVIAVDSDQFGSLRDGTAAVVYDGGFSSARNAKQWCRDNGFPGTQDCFGVVLSDDYTPDQRGDLIRIYDL